MLELGHAAAAGIGDLRPNPVLGQHGARRLADPRAVIIAEAGGIEHGLAAEARRFLVDGGGGRLGAHHEGLAVEFRQRRAAVITAVEKMQLNGDLRPVYN